MTERELEFPTSLGTSDANHIRLLGQDVAGDLMGKVGFGELAFWLVTLRADRAESGFRGRCRLATRSPHRHSRPSTYLSAPDSCRALASLLGAAPSSLG